MIRHLNNLLRSIPSLTLGVVLLMMFASLPIQAQTPKLYTLQQGLPSSRISSLYFDRQNFLWVSSPAGLVRFDGLHFSVFNGDVIDECRVEKTDSVAGQSLPDDNINCVYEDLHQNLWVGASDGLFLLDRRTNAFEQFPFPDAPKPRSVSTIIAHPNSPNLIIVGTNGFGVRVFDVVERCYNDSLSHLLSRSGLGYFSKFYVDSQHWLWMLGRKDFRVINLNTYEVLDLNLTPELKSMVQQSVFTDVVEDVASRTIYLASLETGLYEYDLNFAQLRRTDCPMLRTLPISAMSLAPGRALLLGTEGHGGYIYQRSSQSLEPLRFINAPIDLSTAKIHAVNYDADGNLWMGLYHQGLLFVPKPDDNMQYHVANVDTCGTNLGCVTSFLSLPDGTTIASIDGAGLIVERNGHAQRLCSANSALTSDAILDLELAQDNDYYIGTFQGGVFACRDGKIVRPKGMEAYSQMRVMKLAYDPERRLLFVGTNGEGVYVYDEMQCTCSHIQAPYNAWIEDFQLDLQHQCLWVGSAVSVYRVDLNTLQPNIVDATVGHWVHLNCLYRTANRLWIGSSNGLYYYSIGDDKLHQVPIDQTPEARRAGYHNVISVTGDVDGDLWFATSSTLGRYHEADSSLEYFNSSAVSLVGRFNNRSVANDAPGWLVFGGDNGFVSFSPRTIYKNQRALSPIYFSQLWVSDAEVCYRPGSDAQVLDADLRYATTLTLPATSSSFSISFAALDYADPLRINYSYRLEGYEERWHPLQGGNHNASFANLPPGTYNLQVRASLNTPKVRGSFKQLRVVILPPWYRTTWAFILYLLVGSIVIYVLYRHARELHIEHQRVLNAQHQEQVKEAKLQLFTSMSHDIKTPLTLILSPLKKLLDKRSDASTHATYDLMYRNAMRIMMLVNQQMEIRKIDNGQLKLQFEERSLYDYIEESMSYFTNLATLHEVKFSLVMACDPALKVWFDPNHFDKVLFNLLSNAFKFTTRGGSVTVTVKTEPSDAPQQVSIAIFNSGSSIPADDIDHIFERFYQGKNRDASNGTGIGLNLAQQITTLHHGQIAVANVDNASDASNAGLTGVAFTVTLPLGHAHLAPEECVLTPREEVKPQFPTEAEPEVNAHELNQQDVRSIEVPTGPASDEPKKTRTILVVDDDEEFLNYVKGELSDFNVILATNGEEAWTQLLTYVPEVVVTDYMMPKMDGMQLCQRIKNNPDTDNIPVILLTSEARDEVAIRAAHCNADRFLSKPVNLELLRGTISQAIKVRETILNRLRRSDIGFDFEEMKMDSASQKLMEHVMECIRKNVSNPDFSIVELSQEVGISRVHLNRRLKEIIGCSPSFLVRSIRLKQAAFLLLNSDVSIAEIAYSIGFNTPSYFTSAFTNYFGMSPKEFIAAYQNNLNDEKLKKLLSGSLTKEELTMGHGGADEGEK